MQVIFLSAWLIQIEDTGEHARKTSLPNQGWMWPIQNDLFWCQLATSSGGRLHGAYRRAGWRLETAESPHSSLRILSGMEIIRRYSWESLQPAKIINSKWYFPNGRKNNVKVPGVHLHPQVQLSAAGHFATLSEAVVWKITPVPQFRSVIIVLVFQAVFASAPRHSLASAWPCNSWLSSNHYKMLFSVKILLLKWFGSIPSDPREKSS